MTDLKVIQAGWDHAAAEDAMFNILTVPGYQNGGWDTTAFFAHGAGEIDVAMGRLKGLGVGEQHGRALDFGCGIGRLTQALAFYYGRVDGVDISREMIGIALEHNQHPD